MSKSKKAGRPNVWPKGMLKPLNVGQVPKHLHADIKAYAKTKKAEALTKIEKEATNG